MRKPKIEHFTQAFEDCEPDKVLTIFGLWVERSKRFVILTRVAVSVTESVPLTDLMAPRS